MKRCPVFVHLLLIVLLGGLAYANTFHVPFVLDDLESIVDNASIRSLGNFLPGGSGLDFHFRRCVAYFTFALNYRFGTLDVSGYHLVNLAIHLGSALCVYALARQLLRTPVLTRSRLAAQPGTLGLLAALLFVLHPVQTQAVTYTVQRLTSLCTFFYLLALVLYLAARLSAPEPDARLGLRPLLLLAGAVAVTLLAMFTKEIAFTLPLAALLLDLSFFPGPWRRRLLFLAPLLLTLPLIPLLVAVGGEVSGAGTLVHSRLDIPRLHYLLTQFPVLLTYLRLLLLPLGQNLDYDYPIYTSATGPVLLSLLLLLVLAGLAAWLFWKTRRSAAALDPAWRLVGWGVAWFFLTLAVESSIVPLPDVIFEHRLYLPLAGLTIAAVTLLLLTVRPGRGFSAPRGVLLLAAALLAALGVATWQRNRVWRSEVVLWGDVVSKSPHKVRALYNYGTYLPAAGRTEEAIQVLTRVVALDPQHADAWHNLGRAYLLLGRNQEALSALRTATRLAPGMDNAALNLSTALLRAGLPAEALPLLEAASRRTPNSPEVRFGLGLAYLGVSNLAAARNELVVLRQLRSPLANNLAHLLQRNGSN